MQEAVQVAFADPAKTGCQVRKIAPDHAPRGGHVTISGENFLGTRSVKFNGVPAGFQVVSARTITAIVPAGATTGPIRVSIGAGFAVTAGDFSVDGSYAPVRPRIDSVTPSGSRSGILIAIRGKYLDRATAVEFGLAASTPEIRSAGELLAKVPRGAASGALRVRFADGTCVCGPLFLVD